MSPSSQWTLFIARPGRDRQHVIRDPRGEPRIIFGEDDGTRINGRFSENCRYNEENEILWTQVLNVFKEIIGAQAMSWAFLYWATEPLDNPDYEKFAEEFKAIFGRVPITTTARALTDVGRTKRLIEASAEGTFSKVRFSVLTNKQLEAIFQAFTPEERALVDIVPQTAGSVIPKRAAGKALQFERRLKQERGEEALGINETIACVTGFLVNMVTHSLKLITPVSATEKWPLGYRVIYDGHFVDAEDLREKLTHVVATRIINELTPESVLVFRPDLKIRLTDNGFDAVTDNAVKSWRNNSFYRDVVSVLLKGPTPVSEIVHHVHRMYGGNWVPVETMLQDIFDEGLFDEDIIAATHPMKVSA